MERTAEIHTEVVLSEGIGRRCDGECGGSGASELHTVKGKATRARTRLPGARVGSCFLDQRRDVVRGGYQGSQQTESWTAAAEARTTRTLRVRVRIQLDRTLQALA